MAKMRPLTLQEFKNSGISRDSYKATNPSPGVFVVEESMGFMDLGKKLNEIQRRAKESLSEWERFTGGQGSVVVKQAVTDAPTREHARMVRARWYKAVITYTLSVPAKNTDLSRSSGPYSKIKVKPGLGDVVKGKTQVGIAYLEIGGHGDVSGSGNQVIPKQLGAQTFYVIREPERNLSVMFTDVLEIIRGARVMDQWSYENRQIEAQQAATDPKVLLPKFVRTTVSKPTASNPKQTIFINSMEILVYRIQLARFLTKNGMTNKDTQKVLNERYPNKEGLIADASSVSGLSPNEISNLALRFKDANKITLPESLATQASNPSVAPVAGKKPRRGFQVQNRLGWTQAGYDKFVALTKPGSVWAQIRTAANKNNPIQLVSDKIRELQMLFSGNEAKYVPLSVMFADLSNVADKASNRLITSSDAAIQFAALVKRIQPRLERLWDFSRREALAKAIVVKSLNKRII